MDIKKEITLVLRDLLKEFTGESVKFLIEEPENESFGDYSSNIALVASKILKKNPFDLASELAEKLNSSLSKLPNIDRVEAVKPGFINFWTSKECLTAAITHIISASDKYGCSKSLEGKKIMVEFTDPNPFKEFHIGHLYSNTVGESVSRLLEAMGASLKRANYQGDVGMHVAKAIYGIFHLCHAEFISASQISGNKILKQVQDDKLNKRIKILGEAYSFGAKAYEDDSGAKREIEELNKKIYVKDPAIMGLYEKGRQWSLEYFENIYKRLGTKFDFYYFESEVGIDGLKLVKEYLKKGIFEESQNAVIFPGKKYGLHNRVFINSLGLPTYEAKELGLALRKYRDFKFDQSIVITGNEIIGYFKVLIVALGKINPSLAAKIKHLSHGMVRLPAGKMSSRTGSVVTGEWLLDETKKLLKSKYSEMPEEILEKVAVGAVKYALLKSSLGHDIEFNFEESISIQGDSGPYLQYVYARTQSVLNKCHPELVSGSPAVRQATLKSKEMLKQVQHDTITIEEMSLLRALNKFPEVVVQAAEKFAPNILCNYLFNLAQKFNLFYQKCKVIGSGNQEFRLALTAGVGQVIKNGLDLLGIAAPTKM